MQNLPSVNLKSFNSFGVDATAKRFLQIRSSDQLKKWVKAGFAPAGEILVLGGGTNVLFVRDPEEAVLHIQIGGIREMREDRHHVWVRAGAGVVWHSLVEYALKKNLGGIENLSLIPGLCGAAPMQNIGAYGVELEQVFDHLECINLKTGNLEVFSKDACKFGYRNSVFKDLYRGWFAITAITLRLSKKPDINVSYGAIASVLEAKGIAEPGIRDVSEAVIEIRRSKLPDPDQTGNAGSFFKNPVVSWDTYLQLKERYPDIPGYTAKGGMVKVPAGWLIEKSGWKGKKLGDAGTWHLQALVLVNHGNATGEQILTLARVIRDQVYNVFDILLEPEVNLIGLDGGF